MNCLFSFAGTILRADVLLGPDGRSKGMGTICFELEESAEKAIEKMNEFEVDGRAIYVTKDKFAK
jgi:RNA recognition motif-containing protein